MARSPWATGPGEILQHGISLLKKDSDVNRRLAMISIDNAVELMMKTFLGLPSRITGIKISREKFREISESFPKLLDALEEHAISKLDGINLGEVEWFHRLRNELYHQGNGLTVERDKVEVYSELARLLYKNLFGDAIDVREAEGAELLGHFMEVWVSLERLTMEYASRVGAPGMRGKFMPPTQAYRLLSEKGVIDAQTLKDLQEMNQVRNEVVHGVSPHKDVLDPGMVKKMRAIVDHIQKALKALS